MDETIPTLKDRGTMVDEIIPALKDRGTVTGLKPRSVRRTRQRR